MKWFQQRFEIVEIVHRVYESPWHGIIIHPYARALNKFASIDRVDVQAIAPTNPAPHGLIALAICNASA